MYYLQSRYYDPAVGRFINADGLVATGQGFVGNNMFAYCLNNPVVFVDKDGQDVTYAANWWANNMFWLPQIDFELPFGDIIFAVGMLIICVTEGFITLCSFEELALNTGNPPAADSNQSNSTLSDAAVYSKPVNLPPFSKLKIAIEHIASGHMPGGKRNPKGNKTVFWGLTIDQTYRAIQEAYSNAKKLQTQGNRVLIEGFSRTWGDFIQMWVNIADLIIETAYPRK